MWTKLSPWFAPKNTSSPTKHAGAEEKSIRFVFAHFPKPMNTGISVAPDKRAGGIIRVIKIQLSYFVCIHFFHVFRRLRPGNKTE